jgi:preprotein translocase subunit SecE
MSVRIWLPLLIKDKNRKHDTMEKVKSYFTEAYDELVNKVTWPTWDELLSSGVVVLTAALVISLLVLAMDLSSRFSIQEGLYKLLITK